MKRRKQGGIVPPKKHSNSPGRDIKQMEIYKLAEKKFKIMILRKSKEIQENTDNSIKPGKEYMIQMTNSIKR